MQATLVKRDLDDSVDALGWARALKHLADKARAEGEQTLGQTLKLLSDVMDSAISEADLIDALGLPSREDLAAEIAEYRAQQALSDSPLEPLDYEEDCQYPTRPDGGEW